MEITPVSPKEKCVIEQTLPPIVLGGNCEDVGPACQYVPQGCNEVTSEPRNPCAEKICVPPPEEECLEEKGEVAGPKG
jgi:hypothetical protein